MISGCPRDWASSRARASEPVEIAHRATSALGGARDEPDRPERADGYRSWAELLAGWKPAGIDCEGGEPLAVARRDGAARTGCRTTTNREIAWRARFEHRRD